MRNNKLFKRYNIRWLQNIKLLYNKLVCNAYLSLLSKVIPMGNQHTKFQPLHSPLL